MSYTYTALNADLRTTWTDSNTISAGGTESGMTANDGFNNICTQINLAQTEVNAANAALAAHIEVGGEAQHPDATTSVAGFMSAANLTNLNMMMADTAGQSLGTSGYKEFQGGLILQWGSVLYPGVNGNPSGANPVAVTFPVAFPTGCQVQLTPYFNSTPSPNETQVYAQNITLSGFHLNFNSTGSGTSPDGAKWFAIGY